MTLKISKADGWFLVDDDSRPGSPCIGRGRTIKEAIGDHIHANQTALGIEFEVHESARPAEMRRRRRELSKR
jgi:hypothetical protein